jgi:prepilin-type N-terminal cleavage/methylation domain-containing protein
MRLYNKIINTKSKKGFTLIELLVVVAIIGLLSSVVLASLNSARSKARDAKRKEDFHTMQLAFQLYYDKYGVMPTVPAGGGPEVCEFLIGTSQYITFMNDMVSAGVLSSIIKSPGTQNWGRGYCYYNYGAGNSVGAIFVTQLENSSSTTGVPPSCRPWAAGTNWCDQSSNNYYCLCNPY